MVTISFGIGNTQTRDENQYNTIGQLLGDTSLQASLSFDPNQVDARVNGSIVDQNAGVTGGLRIDLVKKAGKKSNDDALTLEQQLRPIGIAAGIEAAVVARAAEAMAPLYDALNNAEAATAVVVKDQQLAVVEECEPFKAFQKTIVQRLVDTNYVDSAGGLSIPCDVREVIAKIADEADKELEDDRKEVRDAEAKTRAWQKSAIADIGMSVTIADQRKLVAKALASNPMEAWTFEA
jgi:hypothetical protein